MRRTQYITLVACAASAWLGGVASASPPNELSRAAAIDSAYDGKVYNSRGPDYVNRITPRVGYKLVDPRLTLTTGYEFSYWTYAFGKAENSLNHRALLSLEGHPTRKLAITVSDEFA